MIATTPEPPYYAVIFTSVRSSIDPEGYALTDRRMMELATGERGFLGVEHAGDGAGITVSYWTDLVSIAAWKANAEHLAAQAAGRERWYAAFAIRIARVERESRYLA